MLIFAFKENGNTYITYHYIVHQKKDFGKM